MIPPVTKSVGQSGPLKKPDELTLKVSDMETLLDDVSAAAYDKS